MKPWERYGGAFFGSLIPGLVVGVVLIWANPGKWIALLGWLGFILIFTLHGATQERIKELEQRSLSDEDLEDVKEILTEYNERDGN